LARLRLITKPIKTEKQIQNIKPDIAMNFQKKSPNDSNIYSSFAGLLQAQ
jgi:hypothetical protein